MAKLNRALALPLIAASTAAIQSCTVPYEGSLVVYNSSGQDLTFRDCEQQRFTLKSGESAEIFKATGLWGIGTNQWGCYSHDLFVVRTASGERWSYKLWFHKDLGKGLSKSEREARAQAIIAFSALPRPTVSTAFRGFGNKMIPFVPFNIGADGKILLGRWVLVENTSDQATTTLHTRLLNGEMLYIEDLSNQTSDPIRAKARPDFSEAGQPAGFPINPVVTQAK